MLRRPIRRLALIVPPLLAVAALAAPTHADAAASVRYLTTYTGVYTFGNTFLHQAGQPDGITTTQHYAWTVFDYQDITVHRGGRFTTKLTRYIAAKGREKSVTVQGSDQPEGPSTSTRECQIASDLTPVVRGSAGAFVHAIPVRDNPLIPVGWELPDYGGGPQANDAPKFTVTGTPSCDVYRSSFLDWTPSHPAGGITGLASLPPTQRMRDAFSGSTTIRYSAFRYKPWQRRFSNVTLQDKASGVNGATEEAKVVVDSTVTFDRIDDYKPNKIGALLLSEGFLGLGGQGTADGPAGTSGEDETVIIPGLGQGEINLDVQGTVVPPGRSIRAAGPLLAHGTARVGRGDRVVRMKIVPTAEGRSVLRAPHPVIEGRYVMTFKRRGSSGTTTRSKPISIPARVAR